MEKAKLEEKWVISRPGRKKSPADETLRLCQQLEENPDHLESKFSPLFISGKCHKMCNCLQLLSYILCGSPVVYSMWVAAFIVKDI